MGLTTALMLKQQFSNLAIDIIAEKDYSESTSHGAAGAMQLANAQPENDLVDLHQ